MKIVILGSNGMLGSMLTFIAKRYNNDIIPLSRKEFDVERDDIHVLEKYFNKDFFRQYILRNIRL